MTTESMTVHKALVELKILDKKIGIEINEAEFCTCAKVSASKINGMTPDEYKDDTKSVYDRIRDLIRRRDAIKRAISKSNATTVVTINGEEYTVAEAIYMNQTGVTLKQELLNRMKARYNSVLSLIERNNVQVGIKGEEFVKNYTGDKADKVELNSDEVQKIYNDFVDRNKFDLLTGIQIKDEIKKLGDWIDSFKAEVDSALSVSNAVTMIEVSY